MNLREPKKKQKARVQNKSPLPIALNEAEWVVYTAYLTDIGSCITDSDEITAVHSMGFFGKGSLSRSYPSFGKARYGAPPLIRNRQWVRRQEWLQEVKLLDNEFYRDNSHNENSIKSMTNDNCVDDISSQSTDTKKREEPSNNEKKHEEPDIMEIDMSIPNMPKNKDNKQIINDNEFCEIVPCSSEEDVCVIINKQSKKDINKSVVKESNEKDLEDQHIDLNNPGNHNSVIASMHIERGKNDIQGKLLILPDSDSETENYLENIKPRIESESFPVRESLHMTFEETFFLMFGLGCLRLIHFDSTLMDINSAWLYFCKEDKNFIQKYVVYHYFRSKGWVVKPGLKYGGDFLLYKQGPPFYHASYIVIIDVVDADLLTIIPSKCFRKMTWSNLFGLDRLAESAAKEILFAQVLWPSSISLNSGPPSPHMLSEFTVRELLWRRWNPKQNQDVIIVEEEEDDEDSC
ncbi:tRNA-splicing endonuclease subunit Sen2 isoform X2 [Vespa velutina]|uniref:tRNA-splicing endonuclease subunit Sen2 isoform X2 n=1 Tax=Vespa velutina TaxID=202808 RepID=UPI001FB3BB62|nr:tRNA-splicing endonuclease subunit Sen2 isoform X2 [Vespa velutina]